MSLAEDLRRPFQHPRPREGLVRPGESPLTEAERRFAGAIKTLRDATPALAPAEDASDADSLQLIDRASKGVVHILNRYRQLEEHVRQLDAWSKAQVQAAEAAATRWQETAAESERRLREMQQTLDAMSRRADAAEQELQHDRIALSDLQDRIVAAFGSGSEAHDAMAGLDLA